MNVDETIQQPGQKERILKEDIMKSIHVAVPGEILSYNPDNRTAAIQPVIRNWNTSEKPPMLLDVPVFMWGNFTFEPKDGDGCLVVFADSCIDAWLGKSGVSTPAVHRLHSMSDGFAFVGFNQSGGTELGKALKDLADALAEKIDKSKIANNLTTTQEGFVLDARQGKALKDLIDAFRDYTAGTGLTLNDHEFSISQENVSTILNLLSVGQSNAEAGDYLIAQYAGGGETTKTYHRRSVSKVVNGTVVKAALGTSTTHDNDYLRKDGTWAKPPQPDISGKVNKSGDTMTGSLCLKSGAKLQYQGTAYGVGDILKVIDDGDAYGLGVVIGRGGLVVIGAGESQDAIASGKSAGTENLYLGADGDIHLMPNCNSGISSAKDVLINTKGQVQRNGQNSSWYNGRDNALIRLDSSADGYRPVVSAKSYSGSWELGPYTTSNYFYLTFVSDTRYNASQNTHGGQYSFKPLGENKTANMSDAIKSISRSGTTFTATRMDDTTFTFTQQDNNSWRGYQTKQYQVSYTIAANGEKQLKGSDLGMSTPSGYSPVAITYFNTSNSNVDAFYIDAVATGTSVVAGLRNKANSQITATFAIKVLYLQN